MNRLLTLGLLVALGGLAGCSTVDYYWQAVNGHWELMRAARPVADWVNAPQTPKSCANG